MNRDRLAGAVETISGRAMAGVGEMVGDARLAERGRRHRAAGRKRNILGMVREMFGLRSYPKSDPDPQGGFGRPDAYPASHTKKGETMNEDELKGGIRYVKGKIEKGAGDITTDAKWQVDGIVDQVAGGAQNLYGRAKDRAQHIIEDAPGLFADAGDRAREIADRGRRAVERTELTESPWVLVAAAGLAGYALSWLVHGQRS